MFSTPCILDHRKPTRSGHVQVHLSHPNRYVSVHRLAWEQAYGPIPDGLLVCHKCDVPNCVNTDHLFLGTHADNMSDRGNKNRQAKGVDQGAAKLTEHDVKVIRGSYAMGCRQPWLAERYGVHKQTISNVVNRKGWKHIV